MNLFRIIAPTIGALGLVSSAHAQGVVRGGFALTEFFDAATKERVDVVCLGDSNQLHYGGGWDRGWSRALQRRLGVYATGVLTPGEGNGVGLGLGEGYSTIATGPGPLQIGSGPEYVDERFNAARADLSPHSYVYLPEGNASSQMVGVRLFDYAPFDVHDRLNFHYTYGVFGGFGEGSFQPSVRSEEPPYTEYFRAPMTSTRDGIVGSFKVRTGTLELPAFRRPAQLSFRFSPNGRPITGPFVAYGMRIEHSDSRKGASLNTLYAKGSQSSRDMAAALIASEDASLTLFFSQVRMLGSTRVLVRINTGVNDRTENLASVGPERVLNGSSPAAYEDNLIAIISRIREIWRLNEWDERELHFVITPSHPQSSPEVQPMVGYREAARSVADRFARTASVDYSKIVSAHQMAQRRWYYAPFDFSHLSDLGFESLSLLELDSLIRAAACPADLDDSSGIDGDDLVEFFNRWESAAMDFNGDDSTDGDDVIAFFEAWDRGCP